MTPGWRKRARSTRHSSRRLSVSAFPTGCTTALRGSAPAPELESAGAWAAATGPPGSAGQHDGWRSAMRFWRRFERDGIAAAATPYSPVGVRLEAKPALQRHPLFLEGKVEVQDEGSQLLAYLVAPRRREMVVDFCAGAGGKTLALGRAHELRGARVRFRHRREAAVQPEAATEALGTVERAPTAHRERSRCASEAAELKNRPRAGGRSLQRAGNGAPQSRPQVAPGTAGRDRDGGKAARHSGRGSAAGETGRTAGIRHLQPAAGGKRSDRGCVPRRESTALPRSTAARSSVARASSWTPGCISGFSPTPMGWTRFSRASSSARGSA